MARYSAFLGRRVEVQYRAGDILLPASGTFVADSGRSIFLEQQFEQHGQNRHFRWEIPYQCVVRLQERAVVPPAPAAPVLAAVPEVPANELPVPTASAKVEEPPNTAIAAAGGTPAILPLQNRPKTA
jgi:hypothetical protein